MQKDTKDYKRRKRLGQFFTDEKLVDYVVNQFSINFEGKTILEPSCGNGLFIKKILESHNVKAIIGVDIDAKAIESCKSITEKRLTLINKDYLKTDFQESVDIIIGNPPFTLKAEGYVDTTDAFISKSIDVLPDKGELVFVIPSSVFKNKKYESLRRKILSETTIVKIMDTRSHEFDGADFETAVIHLRKKKPNQQKYLYIQNGKEDIVELENTKKNKILISNQDVYKIIKKHIGNVTLGDLFDIYRGKSPQGFRGRNIDFYDDLVVINEESKPYIALQNVAYRLTANVVIDETANAMDTVTLLVPKQKMTIKELQFISNYLNSSLGYYIIHTTFLNYSKLTIHIDKYYIEDMVVPCDYLSYSTELDQHISPYRNTIEFAVRRNEFFIDKLGLNKYKSQIEEKWKYPIYRKKGKLNGIST